MRKSDSTCERSAIAATTRTIGYPAFPAPTAGMVASDFGAILDGVGYTHRGAIPTVKRQAAPAMFVCTARRPFRGRHGKQIFECRVFETLPRLNHGTLCQQRSAI